MVLRPGTSRIGPLQVHGSTRHPGADSILPTDRAGHLSRTAERENGEEDKVTSGVRVRTRVMATAITLAAVVLAAACGGSSTGSGSQSFKGTKNIGLSIALTGQSQLYGHAIS